MQPGRLARAATPHQQVADEDEEDGGGSLGEDESGDGLGRCRRGCR